MPQTGPWTGDPVWLADVLRAEGVNPVEYPGWRSRGHGDFKDIRGVMAHHTGSDNASAASIARGRPDLPGPLSQLHIARDGTVTVVAVGVAWHAGVGMYPWLPTNMGNWHMIGIECANSGTSPTALHRKDWPHAQYVALVRSCAAINRRLAHLRPHDRTQGVRGPRTRQMGSGRHQHEHLAQRHSSPHRHHSQPGADTETAGAGR
jgi:N-acetylmuramoyl-L-alanine amidase